MLSGFYYRLQRKNAGLADLYRVYAFTRSIPRLLGSLQSMIDSSDHTALNGVLSEKYVSKLTLYNEKFMKYQGLIEHVIDQDKLPDLEVNPRHDPDLAELREESDTMDAEIERFNLLVLLRQLGFVTQVNH